MKNTEEIIEEVCESMKNLLLQKNRNYGDSATNPSNVFSKGSAIDSICARIDDKLMRIQNRGINDETEDTVSDLIGYLILLKVAMYKEKGKEYNEFKETIAFGGHVCVNGRNISNMESLDYHYNIKKEDDSSEKEEYEIKTEDNNNSI
tara:strand:- start:1187 stop:1630 length:444 start_codon:yes stop_codon:yes gene_type:complete